MTTALVEGIGGVFVFSRDAARLARWYEENLGIRWDAPGPPYYVSFWSRSEDDPARRMDTSFSILTLKVPDSPRVTLADPKDMYGDQPFMVNLRVRDLGRVLAHLRERGVEILKEDHESYGHFAWVRDGDGNRVELYERVDAA